MPSFSRESLLFAPVARYVRRLGFGRQQAEVQFYEYSMDLYGYAAGPRHTIAIELKLEKWKRAFEQALLYQLCADYSYLALPYDVAMRVDRPLLCKHGLGLIAVNSTRLCTMILPAAESRVLIPGYRDFYIGLLGGRR